MSRCVVCYIGINVSEDPATASSGYVVHTKYPIYSVFRVNTLKMMAPGSSVILLSVFQTTRHKSYIKTHSGEFDQNIAVHNHNTCQKLNLHVQFCRTNVSKNGVMNIGIRLYNKVPNKIREVGKMRQFKRVFRSYLLQQVFYSVEEYMLS
jgi:hypothetical protein